jgi:hypothetical protein
MSHDLAAINTVYRLGCRALPPIGAVVEWIDHFGLCHQGSVQRHVDLVQHNETVLVVSLLLCGDMRTVLVARRGFRVLHVPDDAPPIEEWKGSEL